MNLDFDLNLGQLSTPILYRKNTAKVRKASRNELLERLREPIVASGTSGVLYDEVSAERGWEHVLVGQLIGFIQAKQASGHQDLFSDLGFQ
jgi:hypothetical protein